MISLKQTNKIIKREKEELEREKNEHNKKIKEEKQQISIFKSTDFNDFPKFDPETSSST